jgi:hypothetical protein
MRIMVTPAGATPSLEACSWVGASLPFVPGETLGPLRRTSQRRRFRRRPLLEGVVFG